PVSMAATVVQALNGIVSRKIDPMKPAVCSIGMIQGGGAFNVIPAEVMIGGTLRSFDPGVREQLFVEVERAFSLATAMGGSYELNLQRGYPAGINDATVAQWLDDVASDFIGADNIDRVTNGMGGEDFAYMQQQAPGATRRVGAGIGDIKRPHHTPVFDIDERCIPLGTAILAETVRRYLSR
ncbi:MAG: M20 family metallopeptidase, partial [Roseiflexaceae bacterium]